MEKLILRFAAATSAAALLSGGLATGALADDAGTTRIESRVSYGATITIEEGVRVFRPLPSERHVIVNPGGNSPLSLGYLGSKVPTVILVPH